MFGLCECNCATVGLILTIVFTYLYYKFKSVYSFWEKLGVPCEKSVPLFGSYWENFIGNESILDTHLKIYKGNEGKKFVGTFMMTSPHLFVRDPDLVTHILIRDFSSFQDRGFQIDTKLNPLLENIFFLEGERWKSLRNKLSPVFTSGKLKNMHSLLVQCGELLLEVVKTNTENKEPVDIREIMAKFGTDVIGSCAFGIQTNALTDPDSEFRLMGKKLLVPSSMSRLRSLIRAVFPKLLGYIKMKSFPEKIEQFFLDIVKNTIKMRETNKIDRNDFIQLLLNLRKEESSATDDIYTSGKNSEGMLFLFNYHRVEMSYISLTLSFLSFFL
jgi:cytochrome P450 family 6